MRPSYVTIIVITELWCLGKAVGTQGTSAAGVLTLLGDLSLVEVEPEVSPGLEVASWADP